MSEATTPPEGIAQYIHRIPEGRDASKNAAAIPSGSNSQMGQEPGGVARTSLNHRLIAFIPEGARISDWKIVLSGVRTILPCARENSWLVLIRAICEIRRF